MNRTCNFISTFLFFLFHFVFHIFNISQITIRLIIFHIYKTYNIYNWMKKIKSKQKQTLHLSNASVFTSRHPKEHLDVGIMCNCV